MLPAALSLGSGYSRAVKKRVVALLTGAVIGLAGCAGGEPESSSGSPATPKEKESGAKSFQQPFSDVKAYPVFASSEIVVGPNRLLVGLLNDKDAPIGSPKIDMRIKFFDLAESATAPVARTDMGFVWIDKPYLGLYRGNVRFDQPGRWGAEVVIQGGGLHETVRSSFQVKEESSTPALGSRPPASDTPTRSEVPKLSAITTDDDPTPRFYRYSVAEALEAGRPAVVVFATPKFCASATCGPTLDVVERVAAGFPDVTFVHVEPYKLPADPSNLQPIDAVLDWGLPSEPWVFVMNRGGRVVAKYEGVVSPSELRAQLRELG
jgi:hypothetical protein